MPLPTTSLALLTGACAALCGLLLRRRTRRGRRATFEVNPGYRDLLLRHGLLRPADFLALHGDLVSGHPDRNVARLRLGDTVVYLKRDHRVRWLDRLVSFCAGFGLVSRAVREGRILQALARDGQDAPQWLAAGEDGGRAFLLLAESPGTELRVWLRDEADPHRRRLLARRLGRRLARLHDAGWFHPDLYAKHVLVDGDDVRFLDWPRARRRHRVCRDERGHALAALHATLADTLAAADERLACLSAYLSAAAARPVLKPFLRLVLERTRRLLNRRHIVEKRQPAADEVQGWSCRDGEALCAAPALADAWPGRPVDWLSLERQPPPAGGATARRWLPLPDGRRALLVRRRERPLLSLWWAWLWGRPAASPEQRHAALLWRLRRHGVPAPRVLAMGRRQGPGGAVDSFLLTEPAADAVRLDAWLRGPRRGEVRRRLLRDTGQLLHRLHEAGCFLGDETAALAVSAPPRQAPRPVLAAVDGLSVSRRPSPERSRDDLEACRRRLEALGCADDEVAGFLEGYGPPPVRSAARPLPPAPPPADEVPRPPDGVWRRLWRGVRRLRQRPDWPRFAGGDWADHVMDATVTDRFHAKQGRSTGRWVLPAPDGGEPRHLTVYLKRHHQLPRLSGLLAVLWPRGHWSPALQEWEHLEWARQQGIPVPSVVAAAEFIGPGLRLQSLLAVEELTGMLPLHEAVPLALKRLPPDAFRRWKRGLVSEMARLSRMLHDRRVFHKDLYLCHFYILQDDTGHVPDDWRGRVYLIDLHRLGRHPWTWRWWQLKDLAQLLYSTDVPGVDARDRLWFWQEYRGPGPRRPPRRWLRWLVLFKWRRYQRHNARRGPGAHPGG